QQLEQAADHQGLAGADLTGHDHKTLPPLDAIVKRSQRFIVSPRWKHERRVRRYLEGVSLQIEKALIHSGLKGQPLKKLTANHIEILTKIIAAVTNNILKLTRCRLSSSIVTILGISAMMPTGRSFFNNSSSQIRSSRNSHPNASPAPNRNPTPRPMAHIFMRFGEYGFWGRLAGSRTRKCSPCCFSSRLVAISESFFFFRRLS